MENKDGEDQLRFILQAGVSERYEQLVEYARLWLEGHPSVSILALVKFKETPKYRCPLRPFDNEELDIGLEDTPQMRDFVVETNCGPVTCQSLTWVGKLEGFVGNMEEGRYWTRDTGWTTRSMNAMC